MTPIKTLIPALAALMLTGAAFAADSSAPPPPPAGFGPGGGHGGCHGVFRALSPEEHLIQFQDVKKKMDTLTVTQFRDWRKAECDKFAKLTPDERKKYADGLDARWKALPDSEKVKLYHDAMAMRGKMGKMGADRPHFGRGPGSDRNGPPQHHRSADQTR